VTRMNWPASPTVHENAPTTACPMLENTPCTSPPIPSRSAETTGTCPPAATADPGAHIATRTMAVRAAPAVRVACISRPLPVGSGEDGGDDDEDQHDPADDPEQVIGGAYRAEDH